MCLEQGQVTPATVCNHINADNKKNPKRFFEGPFNSLCKVHHDSTQQKLEKSGFLAGCDAGGWPLDPEHHWRKG